MKYIRTKDGICDLSVLYIQNCNLLKTGCKKLYDKLMSEKIKEADNIEELCDEYVAVGIPFRTFIVDLNELKRSGLDIHSFSRACYVQYKNCAIYGAIYTDKGLIYVAKMNEKGELELL